MKSKRGFTLLLLFLTLGFIFLFCALKRGALDFWMHLAVGRYMVQSQSIPLLDPFAYTAGSSPWVNNWWLSQVLFYLLYNSWGAWGLLLLKALLITILWALILKLALDNGIELFIALPLVVLGVLAGQEGWGLKPHFFTFFLFALTYYVLYQCKQQNFKIPWALVPLFAFWANIHPGYPAGLLLILLFLLEQTQKFLSSPRPQKSLGQEIAPTLLFLGAAVLACFFTPFGPRGFWQPFLHAKDTGLLRLLGEWVSPNFLYPAFYPFEFLLLLLLALLALSPYRPSLFELTSLILFGHLALQSFRHIPLFAVVLMLPLAKAMMGFIGENPRRRRAAPVILLLAILFFIISSPVGGEAKKAGFLRELEENQQHLPIKAIKVLQAALAPGPFFSTYSWNGYELWALGGKYKVFIDGRTLLYPAGVLQDYLQIQEAGYLWESTLKKYRINVILVDNGLPLARLLSLSPHWRKIHEDSLAAVYYHKDNSY
jgi:hypothetical protein